jgi:hypothetical protein
MKLLITAALLLFFSACAHKHISKSESGNTEQKTMILDRGTCKVVTGDTFNVYKQVCLANEQSCDDELLGVAKVLSIVNTSEVTLDISDIKDTEEIAFFEHKFSKERISSNRRRNKY